jgi:hypothetical protein
MRTVHPEGGILAVLDECQLGAGQIEFSQCSLGQVSQSADLSAVSQ